MSKYDDLIKIIDTFRDEAPAEHKRYHPDAENMSGIENARSRAFIHLFLKVKLNNERNLLPTIPVMAVSMPILSTRKIKSYSSSNPNSGTRTRISKIKR